MLSGLGGGSGQLRERATLKLHVLMMPWWFSNDLMYVKKGYCIGSE